MRIPFVTKVYFPHFFYKDELKPIETNRVPNTITVWSYKNYIPLVEHIREK